MVRSKRSKPKPEKSKPRPQIIDERPPEKVLPRSKEAGDRKLPIRTVLYVEVGDLPSQAIGALCMDVMKKYAQNEHPHYVLPVRNGKLGPDIVFEEEWLKTIRQLCKVENGEIVFKHTAREVDIIRKRL